MSNERLDFEPSSGKQMSLARQRHHLEICPVCRTIRDQMAEAQGITPEEVTQRLAKERQERLEAN